MGDKSDFTSEDHCDEEPVLSGAPECNTYEIPASFKFYSNELISRDLCHVSCLPSNAHLLVECARNEAVSVDCAVSIKKENCEAPTSSDHLHSVEIIFYDKSLGTTKTIAKRWLDKEQSLSVLLPGIANSPTSFQPYERLVNVVEVKILLRLLFTTLRAEKSCLSKSYESLFKNQSLCDVHFDMENNESLGAHVPILIARSPVFAAMFAHDTQEARSRRVNVPDCKSQTFETFLECLYTGCLPKFPTVSEAMELYTIADKYQVEDLKSLLVGHLKAGVGEENAISLLTFAHCFFIASLKEVCMGLIGKSGREICRLPQWEDFARSQPELCTQAVRRILSLPDEARPETVEAKKPDSWSPAAWLWVRLAQMSYSVYQFLFC